MGLANPNAVEGSMRSAALQRNELARTTEPSLRGGVWMVLDLAPTKRGSMEEQLLALGARLRADGVPVTFVFAAAPAPWLAERLRGHGVATRTLEFRTAIAPLRFSRWMSAARPLLVHFHFVRAYSSLVALARAVGARTVVHEHFPLGFGYVTPGLSRRRIVTRLADVSKRCRAAMLDRLVDRRVAVSRFVADTVRRTEFVAPSRVTIVENGIDLGRFVAADPTAARAELAVGDRALVVCVSRLALEKGLATLVRAHAQLGRDAVLALAGAGPDEPLLRALADELGSAGDVRFLGVRDDVERLLAAADVVVQPSRYEEAFGLSVVEAMACGKPIVVTDSGAMPELVDHGGAGLVVPKDDPAAMAAAIRRLLDDAWLAATLGSAARARARRYDMDAFVRRVVALYRELCPALAGRP